MSDNKPMHSGNADDLPEVGTIWRHKNTGKLFEVIVVKPGECVMYIPIGETIVLGMATLVIFKSDFVLTDLVKANNMVAK